MKHTGTRKLVIAGGGTAGWMAAAALVSRLKPEYYEITVVESSHISTIGVGESVVPSVTGFIRDLGLDEQDFIEKTEATVKLGTMFRDWSDKGQSFFHPLGTLGCELEGNEFFQCWLKAKFEGDSTPLTDYSPAAVMAKSTISVFPSGLPSDSPLLTANPALHLDSSLMRQYLVKFAEERQVKIINSHIVNVNMRENGSIESLELNNRQTVQGDFFIDCSGFRGLLIDEALDSPFLDWKQFLPCDRVAAMQTAVNRTTRPYTISTARESGWAWSIPLRSRVSSGFVYSSSHCSDTRAEQILRETAVGEPLHDPQFIPLRTGMREQMWKKNCVALGLAGGFLEPLESANIHLVTHGVKLLMELFPGIFEDQQDWPTLAAEYNARMRSEYEEIRDFTILHYCTTSRVDSEFWRRCQSNPLPDSLVEKIELFRVRGVLRISDDSLFQKSSWQAVFTGMGVFPQAYHPLVDMADFGGIQKAMLNYRTQLEDAIESLPQTGNSAPSE